MTLLLKNSENCTCIFRQFFIFKHRVCVHLKTYTNYFNKKIYSGVCCKKVAVFDYKAKLDDAKFKRYKEQKRL